MVGFGLLVLAVGLLVGLFWLQNNLWGPRQKRRMMQRRPFTDLPLHGFRLTENAFTAELQGPAGAVPLAYVGQRQGYAVEISYGWTDRPELQVRVFFDPGSEAYDVIKANWESEAKKLSYASGWFLAPFYADGAIPYSFIPPKAERLLQLADLLVERVQLLHRRPMTYAEACSQAQAFVAESARRSQR